MKTYESQLGVEYSTSEIQIIHELRQLVFKTINNFDLTLIYVGAISFVECLLTFYSLLIPNTYQTSFLTFLIFRTSLLLLQCAIYFGGGSVREDNSTLIYLTAYISIAYNLLIMFFALGGLKMQSLIQSLPIILPILLGVGQFSNSFIVYGAMTGNFLLSSLVLIATIQLIRNQWFVNLDLDLLQ